jgi:hypothetical protein
VSLQISRFQCQEEIQTIGYVAPYRIYNELQLLKGMFENPWRSSKTRLGYSLNTSSAFSDSSLDFKTTRAFPV